MGRRITLLIFGLLFLIVTPVFADTVYPAGARYVIVNPNGNLKASTTFLLDTKTGKTWQYVQDSSGATIWEQKEYEWYKQDGTLGGKTIKPPVVTSP